MVEKFDYIESQADADDLIEEFGQLGAIPRSTTVPGENPWDAPTETTVLHPVKVAVLPIELQHAGRDVDGTLIKSDDVQILASVTGLSIDPTTSDLVLVNGVWVDGRYEGGQVYTILRCNTLAPAGVPVMHDIIGRF